MNRGLTALIALALLSPAPEAAPGFFTVARQNGIWWFINPAGQPTLSIGVNMVNQGIDPGDWDRRNPSYSARRLFRDEAEWQKHTLDLLRRWGFNTIGAWGDTRLMERAQLPFTVYVGLAKELGVPWRDVWDPSLDETLARTAKERTAPWRDNPLLIGYFTDNEVEWWDETLFAFHLGKPWRTRREDGTASEWVINQTKVRLVDIIKETYQNSVERLSADWEFGGFLDDEGRAAGGDRRSRQLVSLDDLREPVALKRRLGKRPRVIDRFMLEVYERYVEMSVMALRGADPNHLVLGERYRQYYTPDQIRVAGKWYDVISINYGARVPDGWVSPNHLAAIERLSGRPVLVGEFYFAATENASGSRNSKGEFPVLRTQAERAKSYATQVRQMAAMPQLVGWHWFQYYDQPAQADENYNMGLLDVFGRQYSLMAGASIEVNREAHTLHEGATRMPVSPPQDSLQFAVPRASIAPTTDGDLRDWDKPATWLPLVTGEPNGVPLGDVFVSTSPGALNVAAQYQFLFRDNDFVQRDPGLQRWPEQEGERLTIVLSRPDGTALRTITWAMFPGDQGWRLLRDSGGKPLKWSKTLRSNHGATVAFEGTIPLPASDPEVLFALTLRSRADAQVMRWGSASSKARRLVLAD